MTDPDVSEQQDRSKCRSGAAGQVESRLGAAGYVDMSSRSSRIGAVFKWICVGFLFLFVLGRGPRVYLRWAQLLHKHVPTGKLDSEVGFSAIMNKGILHYKGGRRSARSCQISYTNPL